MRGGELLSELVNGEGPLPPAAALALRAAFRAWLADSGPQPMARLRVPSTPTRARLAVRDHHLARAATYCDGSSWNRAKELGRLARRFRAGRWRALRSHGSPPGDLAPMERELWLAFQACDELPESPEGMHRILRSDGTTRKAENA